MLSRVYNPTQNIRILLPTVVSTRTIMVDQKEAYESLRLSFRVFYVSLSLGLVYKSLDYKR